MTKTRKLAQQKPPPGIVWIEDYVHPDGSVLLGIASRLGITESTYRKWRMRGKGPLTFFLGARVAARIVVIDDYLKRLEEDALAAAAKATRPTEARLHLPRAPKAA